MSYDDLPADATRLSKSLNKLASSLAVRGITVERMKRGKQRGIKLRRQGMEGHLVLRTCVRSVPLHI